MVSEPDGCALPVGLRLWCGQVLVTAPQPSLRRTASWTAYAFFEVIGLPLETIERARYECWARRLLSSSLLVSCDQVHANIWGLGSSAGPAWQYSWLHPIAFHVAKLPLHGSPLQSALHPHAD